MSQFINFLESLSIEDHDLLDAVMSGYVVFMESLGEDMAARSQAIQSVSISITAVPQAARRMGRFDLTRDYSNAATQLIPELNGKQVSNESVDAFISTCDKMTAVVSRDDVLSNAQKDAINRLAENAVDSLNHLLDRYPEIVMD